MNPQDAGIFFLNKPSGITSYAALYPVKRIVAPARAGHTGTLDSFAEGMLVALCGRATKLVPLFMDLPKVYRAKFTFGKETDTLDPTGEITGYADIPDSAVIERVLPRFIGEIEQIPPLYSAVHVNGERAYNLARKGIIPQMRPRKVFIGSIELIEWKKPDLDLRITCSKGTYVRSLARDLGRECNSMAFTSLLIREQIGTFGLHDTVAISDVTTDSMLTDDFVINRIDTLPKLFLKDIPAEKIGNGLKLREGFFMQPPLNDGYYRVYTQSDEHLLCVVKRNENSIKYIYNRLPVWK